MNKQRETIDGTVMEIRNVNNKKVVVGREAVVSLS